MTREQMQIQGSLPILTGAMVDDNDIDDNNIEITLSFLVDNFARSIRKKLAFFGVNSVFQKNRPCKYEI